MYKAIYLPIQKEKIEEGDIVINKQGEHFTFSEMLDLKEGTYKAAILCLVEEIFNERLVVGIPLPANGWLKAGMEVKESSCQRIQGMKEGVLFLGDKDVKYVPVYSVQCPVCGKSSKVRM